MSVSKNIDSNVKKSVYGIFWRFLDPLDQERLFGELKDVIDRNLDITDPDRIIAPDHFDIAVNNNVFIKHARHIKKIEQNTIDRIHKYIVEKDYVLNTAKIALQITSSSTVSAKKIDIQSTISPEEQEPQNLTQCYFKIIQGEGTGATWHLSPGETYKIGRISSAHICLPYQNISKHQATLYFISETRMTIVDEGSANGTFINDETEPVKGSREFQPGDFIKFCKKDPVIMTLTIE
ncbi:MAG: FHA domain-containing protein [Calditrichaeota bacterium]|nr:MAG: FHA domain-containing protein [Calditrichota bacterium]